MPLSQQEKFKLIDEIKVIKDRLEETESNIAVYGSMSNEAIINLTIEKTEELSEERRYKLIINNEGVNKPVFMPEEVKNSLLDGMKSALNSLKGVLPTELENKINLLNGE